MTDKYDVIKFSSNPFSRFSAEEEEEYLHDIFVQPKYYQTTKTDIKSGSSRFIFGARGAGKSALVLNLKKDLEKDQHFTILVDDYEGIDISNSGKQLLLLTLKKLETSFGIFLLKNKQCIKSLDAYEKEKLSFFTNTFFESLSDKQAKDLYDKTTHIKSINIVKRICNLFLVKPINTALSAGHEIVGSTICRALGLPSYAQISESVYKEYLSEFQDTKPPEKIVLENFDYSKLKSMLIELSEIIKKCGFNGVVIIYDKIDEYHLLNSQITSIADFVKDLVLDTALLLNNNISLVFSFWSKIRQCLADKGARFDKLKPIDITWTNGELEKITGDRLAYFSNKKITSLSQIMPTEKIGTVLRLAHGSPRHLISLLAKIHDEQININEEYHVFSKEAIEKGFADFAASFDFGTIHAGTNKGTLGTTIDILLRINKLEFEVKNLIDTYKIGAPAANNRIRQMREYGLIEEIPTATRTKQYRVTEPRIAYMIENNLSRKN